MNTTLYLLLTLPAAALLWWLFVRWETSYNARRIKADGVANSLRFWFHLRRLLVRAAVAGVLAAGGAWPAGRLFGLAFGGQVAAFAGCFLYAFNPALNKLRGLAIDYVSASPTTAWLDRKLWARAVRAYPDFNAFNDAELHQNRQAYAAHELRVLRAVALGAGLTFYAAALVALLLLRP